MPWSDRGRVVHSLVLNQQFSICACDGRLRVKEWLMERLSEHWAAAAGMRQSKLLIEGLLGT
jgi:hypothetical protein